MINVYFFDRSVKPGLRFVRKSKEGDFYEWVTRSENNVGRYHAQGTCDANDLPAHIRKVCDLTAGMTSVFYASEWP